MPKRLNINSIYNLDVKDFLKNIKTESVDLVITDPPYKVTSRGNEGNSGGMMKNKLTKDGNIFKHNNIKVEDWASEVYRIMKPQTHCYIMINNKNLIKYLNVFTFVGFLFIKDIIWEKGNKIMGTHYMGCYEHILFFRKGKSKKINYCGTPDILKVKQNKTKGSDGKNIHDTEKPVELLEILIENSTNEGDLVIDPFCGINATGKASLKLNRDFIVNDIDEKYYNFATQELEQLI